MANAPSVDSLLEIFSFEKKADLVRHCKELTVASEDWARQHSKCVTPASASTASRSTAYSKTIW